MVALKCATLKKKLNGNILMKRTILFLATNLGIVLVLSLIMIIAEVVLGILASIIVMWFSRQRELRADAGGAQLAGRGAMFAALESLKAQHEPAPLPEKMAVFGISGGLGSGVKRLFMTHPPLEEGISMLKQ